MKKLSLLVALTLALCPVLALAETAAVPEIEAYTYEATGFQALPEALLARLGVAPAVELTDAMQECDVTVADTVALTLPVNAGTGYNWKLIVPEGATATEGVILNSAAGEALMGGGTLELWGLTFAKAGEYVVTAEEYNPVQKLMSSYHYYITVQ